MKKIIIKIILGVNSLPCAAWQAVDQKGVSVFYHDQPIETCPAPHAEKIGALFLQDNNWSVYFTLQYMEQYYTQARLFSFPVAVYEAKKWNLWPSHKHLYNHYGSPNDRCKQLYANLVAIVGAEAIGNFSPNTPPEHNEQPN